MEEENNQVDEEMSYEDICEENDMNLEVLKALLIQKGVITEDEFEKKLGEMFPDEEE